ncbi:MAG: cobalamin B12-binding domain-containing protein [Gemmatimonadetes bacterium]|nr:cobalamin B12-binding domain-containing protein [Gemmatimonadota bacterium]
MAPLRIAILDLVSRNPTHDLHARIMNANFAGIMPQVVAVWCRQAGHRVTYVCYTGFEDLTRELPADLDVLFVAAFTQAAQFAYAVSHMARRRGAVTVLGGAHARCYPEDAARYFDFVLGLTDRQVLDDLLRDAAPHRPVGVHLTAKQQPVELPSLEERWGYVEPTIRKARALGLVPMLGSLGCPYTCSFCIDSVVDYRPLSFEQLRNDLRFLSAKVARPWVGWHDPNFGVRFDEFMDAIEDAAPPNRIRHVAESSLSLLSEPHLRRLRKNGFAALLPGIESWFDFGNKSKTGKLAGEQKLRQVAEHVNLILRYVPYVQANFILGLDSDEGAEPFELTKAFIDRVPGAYPALSPLTAYGRVAPLNLEFQRAGRVVPVPFQFLNNRFTNLRPRHYGWVEFYDRIMDLHRYAFSWRSIRRRLAAQGRTTSGWVNLLRAVTSDGRGRLGYYRMIRRLLHSDISTRRFFEGESTALPAFFQGRLRRDLGNMFELLPNGALEHDPYAYLKSQGQPLDLVQLA